MLAVDYAGFMVQRLKGVVFDGFGVF